jgi:hypothetical protein
MTRRAIARARGRSRPAQRGRVGGDDPAVSQRGSRRRRLWWRSRARE